MDAGAAAKLGAQARGRGRPWAPDTAWAALWMASGLEPEWAGRQTRYRLARRLRAAMPDGLAWACRGRADVRRFRGAESFIGALSSRLALTGASALEPARDLMAPSSRAVDGYCAGHDIGALVDEFFLVDDPAGNVTLRATGFALITPGGAIPPAVVGIDLLESSDPREAAAGRAVLEGLLR